MPVCSVPGCPTLCDGGKCDAHRKQAYNAPHRKAARKASDAKRPNARQRGYDRRWEQTRRFFLKYAPTCEDCGALATDVDHVDGEGPLGLRGHDFLNLRAYCHACHSRRTARDQPGGWAAEKRGGGGPRPDA